MLWMILIIVFITAYCGSEGISSGIVGLVIGVVFAGFLGVMAGTIPEANNYSGTTKFLNGTGTLVNLNSHPYLQFVDGNESTLIDLADVDIYSGQSNYTVIKKSKSAKHFWLETPFHLGTSITELHLKVPNIKNG